MSPIEIDRLVCRIQADLGDLDDLTVPRGYPGSTALAVIDSIQSMGVRYGNVTRVVARYRDHRYDAAGDPETDGVADLLTTFAEHGGAQGWADKIGTQHRTSTHPGAVLKAAAILAAGEALDALGIDSADDFRGTAKSAPAELTSAWKAVPGQRSGLSLRYAQARLGLPEVKPDRMILRYLADGGAHPSPAEAGTALIAVAARLGVEPFVLDHNLWLLQSGRRAR